MSEKSYKNGRFAAHQGHQPEGQNTGDDEAWETPELEDNDDPFIDRPPPSNSRVSSSSTGRQPRSRPFPPSFGSAPAGVTEGGLPRQRMDGLPAPAVQNVDPLQNMLASQEYINQNPFSMNSPWAPTHGGSPALGYGSQKYPPNQGQSFAADPTLQNLSFNHPSTMQPHTSTRSQPANVTLGTPRRPAAVVSSTQSPTPSLLAASAHQTGNSRRYDPPPPRRFLPHEQVLLVDFFLLTNPSFPR
jgi:hypothetical protein